jgi:hypothetical protein
VERRQTIPYEATIQFDEDEDFEVEVFKRKKTTQ